MTVVLNEEGYEVFADVFDLPTDGEDPSLDVGDKKPEFSIANPGLIESIALPSTTISEAVIVSAAALAKKKRLVVPLRRTIKKDMEGRDVKAMARALSKWEHQNGFGAYRDNPTGVFGEGKVKRLKHFQHSHHVKADGQYGPETHRLMLRYFDRWGARMMRNFHPDALTAAAEKLVNVAVYELSHCGHEYTQDWYWRAQRYHQHLKLREQRWWRGDCSGTTLGHDYVVGVPTSKVGPYDGWTGSMQQTGVVVTRQQCRPGDEVYYDGHVGRIIAKKSYYDIRIFTHGHSGGPFNEDIDYRDDIIEIRRHA